MITLNESYSVEEIDAVEEVAWSIIEQKKWIPIPQLLFALKAFIVETMAKETLQ